ncbi:PLP-dependent aminotransferase family protein [Streptomyces sp. NPDC003077]|uniref:MocR-like pyridoxine biosynthesis transcription factor PdxR n=1 Tax=Streptomyces sp. NPDC003077 TaxID=3154443 RepID=UPI0033B49ED2
MDLFIEMAPRGGRGRAVEEALRAAIVEGRLAAGTRLPPTRGLADELGLARGTVNQAYAQLVAEGWLTTAGRAGTYVAAQPSPEPPSRHPHGSAAPAPRHDLGPGRPDVSAFPRQAWLRALRHALREAPAEVFGYGDPRGRPELRAALAGYLGRVRGVRVDPGHVVVCSGYTQALGLLADVFAGVGVRRVGMEDPALADHATVVGRRLTVVDAGVDAEGMSVTALEEGDAGAAVCTPAHQFPLGVSMSPARRARLLAWAQERDGWIVEDDYDGEFRYDKRPVGALQGRHPGRVVYVGSTSKSLGPGVRLGWIACPPPLLDALVEAKRLADRATSPLDQLALATMLTTGAYDRHLRTMRRAYRYRRDALAARAAARLPHARITGIAAGLHAILELPPTAPPEDRLVAALDAASVRVHPLGAYLRSRPPAPAAPRLVVGYAAPPSHAYSLALEALFGALERAC